MDMRLHLDRRIFHHGQHGQYWLQRWSQAERQLAAKPCTGPATRAAGADPTERAADGADSSD